MKFCSKCGRHYKDSDTFCKDCGIRLTQGTAGGSGLDDVKETASQALSEAGSKAREAFSEENRQKLHDKASAAASSLKNMDAEKGKEMLDSGVSRFHALSGKTKKIIAGIVVVLIAFGCYEYFSPEKQVERAMNHSIEVMSEIGAKDADELTNGDIEKYASLYPKQKRAAIMNILVKSRDYAVSHPGAVSGKGGALKSVLVNTVSDVKIKSVSIQGDKAVVTLVNKDGANLGTQNLKKVDGDWYLSGLSGDND